MIFVNKKDNRVVLITRKCGWCTLAHPHTGLPSTNKWHNYSSSKKWLPGNPDKGVWPDDQMPWDNSFWKDYDIILLIRDPIERYASGIAQLFQFDGLGDGADVPKPRHVVDGGASKFNNWWKKLDKSDLSFNDSHTANWLYLIKDMEYNSMQIVKTEELNNWLESEGITPKKVNQTPSALKSEIKQIMGDKSILEYLKPEVEMYNYLLDKHYKE